MSSRRGVGFSTRPVPVPGPGARTLIAALTVVVVFNLVLAAVTAMPAAAAPTPTVTAVSPVAGSPTGGTVVAVTGTGFVAGSTSVSFGSTSATSVVCSTTTACSATSPAGSSGVVDVTVTTSSGTSATSSADHIHLRHLRLCGQLRRNHRQCDQHCLECRQRHYCRGLAPRWCRGQPQRTLCVREQLQRVPL